ncbi:MAG: SpvB/TcaC N-terminal domain-containing protein, partial [Actinomycetota bacterium]
MTGPIRTRVGDPGSEQPSLSGVFSTRRDRTAAQGEDALWTVRIGADLPDGSSFSRDVVLWRDARAELEQALASEAAGTLAPTEDDARFGAEGAAVSADVEPARSARIRLGTDAGADVPAGAVDRRTRVTIRHLSGSTLPAIDAGLINVTAPRAHGYEFLPHGQRFLRPVTVIVPYDPALLPEGRTPNDVQTYFYDPSTRRWQALPRASIDLDRAVTTSLTDHFTIMINAVLTVPESPSPLSFDPTSISSLAAADPGANIDLIEAPAADSSGDARLTFPIRLPPGRGDFSPSLAIGYASSGGNGWLGVGWDLRISRIEVETRFGVPVYDGTERYLFDGDALVPTTEPTTVADGPTCASGAARRYRPRVEGAFSHILRCGDSPAGYHWEVRDRAGTLFVYGDTVESRLASYAGDRPIFAWMLRSVADTNGNATRFGYQPDASDAGEPFRQIYPATIDYTEHPSAAAAYHVRLLVDDGTRPDQIVTGRPGFKVVTRRLLRAIEVNAVGERVRTYVLAYAHGQFGKSVLERIQVFGERFCVPGANAFVAPACSGRFHEHRFDYIEEPQGFLPPRSWDVDERPSVPLTRSESISAQVQVYGGVSPIVTCSKQLSAGLRIAGGGGARDEQIAFVDVNGDGLPDQLFNDGFALFNQFQPDRTGLYALRSNAPPGDPLAGPTAVRVEGLPGLGHETHINFNASLDGYAFGANASLGVGGSFVWGDAFLTDVDGDGFLDRLSGSETLFSNRDSATAIVFARDHDFLGPETIRASDDVLLGDLRRDAEQRLFVADPVQRWVAPFAGRVHVAASAQRLYLGGEDGVQVEVFLIRLIRHDAALLARLAIAADDTDPHVLLPGGATVTVAAGDALYLKVGTVNEVPYRADIPLDEVRASLGVEYEEYCPSGNPAVCGDSTVGLPVGAPQHAMNEPTGEPVFHFDSGEDFRVAGSPGPAFALPATGRLSFDAVVGQRQPIPEDLRVCLQLLHVPPGGAPDFTTDIPCEGTASFYTRLAPTRTLFARDPTRARVAASADVTAGDLLVLRVESDFSYDPADVMLTFAPNG